MDSVAINCEILGRIKNYGNKEQKIISKSKAASCFSQYTTNVSTFILRTRAVVTFSSFQQTGPVWIGYWKAQAQVAALGNRGNGDRSDTFVLKSSRASLKWTICLCILWGVLSRCWVSQRVGNSNFRCRLLSLSIRAASCQAGFLERLQGTRVYPGCRHFSLFYVLKEVS